MRGPAEILIKKTLRDSSGGVVFASLFGSYRRRDYDAFSDIDVFVVHEEEDEKPRISDGLKRLERMLNRGIHMNLFSLKEFENRLRFHDYLLTSIIEDSSFILGRRDIFYRAKRGIREARPDEEAVSFNRQMGFETLKRVCSFLDGLNSINPRNHRSLLDYATRGLNDYRLALGYLSASAQMQPFGGNAASALFMRSNVSSALRGIARIERNVKRASRIDYMGLRKLLDEIMNRSLRILSMNKVSLGRLIPLIECCHTNPLLKSIQS